MSIRFFQITVLLISFSWSMQSKAQNDSVQTFSLKDCINFASSNNSSIKIARYDQEVGIRQIREVKGRALPQANITGNFEDRLKIPILIIPGASALGGATGDARGIKMGYQYNTNLTGEVTQMIFDPSFYLGLRAAKQSNILYSQNTQQITEQNAFNIANAYYTAIISQKQLQLLKTNLTGTNTSLRTTELQFQNGVAKEVDVKRLRVSRSNLESQIKQAELSVDQSLNNLKFQMGLPLEKNIVLTDTILNFTAPDPSIMNVQGNYHENRIEYKKLRTNIALKEIERRNTIQGYYPTLTAFANYGYQGQGPNFGLWKSSGNEWVDYTTSSIGLRLRIPVFDGLQRTFRSQQSKIQLKQLQENLNLTKQNVNLEVFNASAKFQNAIDRLKVEEENVKLAEDVYKITQLEFREGVSTSTDLVESETTLRQSQNNYTQSLLNLYMARLEFERAKGTITNYLLSN